MIFLKRLFSRPPDLSGLKLGPAGEKWVAYLYQKKGYKILAQNYALFGQKKLGEIDIICRRGKKLVIVEVKTRRSETYMDILDAVGPKKQSYLRRMTALYLQTNPQYENFEIQIDLAGVLMDPFDNSVKSVKLIENAIEGT